MSEPTDIEKKSLEDAPFKNANKYVIVIGPENNFIKTMCKKILRI
jgi:hypothetical protein